MKKFSQHVIKVIGGACWIFVMIARFMSKQGCSFYKVILVDDDDVLLRHCEVKGVYETFESNTIAG
jgi:hypothetical protein